MRLVGNPGLVAAQAGNASVGRQLVGITQRDPMLDRGATAVDGLDDGQKSHVEADGLVFGMVGNPGNLVRVQTRVDGVQHAADAADAKVQLQMAVAVPGQGRHALAERNVQAIQRVRHLA